MATVLETTPAPPPDESDAALAATPGDSVVLSGISWKMYRKLRKMPENYNKRMTYDQGELEIMSPSAHHEQIATFLGDMIVIWTLELDIEIVPCRTMTIRRADLERSLEPDNCYYVQHEAEMRDKKKINFKVDPPPDLAIEVEVSRNLLDKVNIYAALRVPELWRWSGNSLKVFELSNQGEYVPRDGSICFPALPIAQVEDFVRRLGTMGRTALLRTFRDWVRANALPHG